MKKLIFLLHAGFLLLILTANGQGTYNNRNPLNEIDEFIIEQMEIFHVPGLSACIVIGDSVVWNNNYGYMNLEDSIPVNDSTLFNVFSIGKSLTATCVMQLRENQLLDLDENVNDFLPFQIDSPWNNPDSISARMLMSHTSAINDWNFNNFITIGDPTITLGNFLENYLCPGGLYYGNSNFYNVTPGSSFHYDNYGVALNGYLVEPLTGIDFYQYARDSLLAPLNMTASAWFLNELNINNLAIGYTYSNGNFLSNEHLGHPAYPGLSLHTTALELSNFVIMLLNHGVYKELNILSGASVDLMETIQNPDWTYSYGITGLGMFSRDDFGDRIVWGHNGGSSSGYAAHYYLCNEQNSGIVITTNSEQYVDPIVEYLFDYALNITNISENPELRNTNMIIYPNPSSGIVNIKFDPDVKTKVKLSISNINGQEIKYILLESKKSDNYTIKCDEFSPGVYFITLQTDSGTSTKKLIIK